MKKKFKLKLLFYVIKTRVKGFTGDLYFNGNANTNGTALFGSNPQKAKFFANPEEADLMRLSVCGGHQQSSVEPIEF